MPIPEKLKELILANDSNNTFIDISNRGLKDKDMEELKGLLKNNKYITTIDLSRNNLSQKSAVILSSLVQLKIIKISENNIDDEGTEKLINMPNLKELNLSSNNITNRGAELILDKCGPHRRVEIYENPAVTAELIDQIEAKNNAQLEVKNPSPSFANRSSHWHSGKSEMIKPLIKPLTLSEREQVVSNLKRDILNMSPTLRSSQTK